MWEGTKAACASTDLGDKAWRWTGSLVYACKPPDNTFPLLSCYNRGVYRRKIMCLKQLSSQSRSCVSFPPKTPETSQLGRQYQVSILLVPTTTSEESSHDK